MSNLNDTAPQPKVEIAVRNFGPIPEGTVDLRPLTVFLGPSNTGKTYFATLVYALHGVFAGSAPKAAEDIVYTDLERELRNCFDLETISALQRVTGEHPDEMSLSLRVRNGTADSWGIHVTAADAAWTLRSETDNGSAASWHAGNRYYLPAARSGLMQQQRLMASSLREHAPYMKDEHLLEMPFLSCIPAAFLQHIRDYQEDKTQNGNMRYLAKRLEAEVLSGHLHVSPSACGYPEVRYRPHGARTELALRHASSVVAELAPLVMFLRSIVHPGDFLIIEEPEAHLHPGAQVNLALTLGRLVRAGVKVLVTTHSDWLVEEISTLMLEGMLDGDDTEEKIETWLLPEEVGVWRFRRCGAVTELPFEVRGGIYPEEYEDVSETQYNRAVALQTHVEKQEGGSTSEST